MATSLALPSIARAQTAFEPGIEGQIWKQLPYVGAPSCASYDSDGNCLVAVDLSLGKYQFPKAIATDVLPAPIPGHGYCDPPTNAILNANPRIINYVTDQWNNRVQAFDYCGNPVPFETPTGAIEGLASPESIAVDAAHQIIVADKDHGRLAIFAPDSTFVREILIQLVDSDSPIAPSSSLPTGVAVFPDTIVGPSGSGFIAVMLSQANLSALQVYDAQSGLLVATNQEGACQTATPQPHCLDGPSGVTVDAAGLIYVANYAKSRINVYTAQLIGTPKALTFQFTFGLRAEPTLDLQDQYPIGTSSPTAQPYLQSPFNLIATSVTLPGPSPTTQQRLIVSDQDNQRVAVYAIAYPNAPDYSTPVIDFLFALDAEGDLDGFPSAVAQDAEGRIYAVDTGNGRIQRFEVPQLAIVDLRTDPINSNPIPPLATFAVTAGVAVPPQKTTLANVLATICAADAPLAACGKDSTNVMYLEGPFAGIVSAIGSGSDATPVPLEPGQIAYFTWHYTAGSGGNATFTLAAAGGPAATPVVADPSKTITVSIGCLNCEHTPPTTGVKVDSSGSASPNYYAAPATVTLTADDAGAGASGVQEIRVHFTGTQVGSTLGEGWSPCTVQLGVTEYCARPASPQPSFGASFTITSEGTTTVFYRAKDAAGNIEPTNQMTVVIDASYPSATFHDTPAANLNGWHNADSVSATYMLSDGNGSGVDGPTSGSAVFPDEGITTWAFHVADRVGHGFTTNYAVQIDRTPPVITAPAPIVAELSNITGTSVPLAAATATDALSGGVVLTDKAPAGGLYPFSAGPSTVCSANQCVTTVTFTATDAAGNVATKTTTVTIRDTTGPTITLPAQPSLTTGQSLPDLTPQVVAVDLNGGAVAVTQSPAAGSPLTLGANTVTFTAKDRFGNASARPLSFIVGDGTPPTSSCTPVTLTVDPTTHLATVGDLRSHATASDNSGAVTVTQQSPDGSALPVGTHPLIFTATDASNNTASCSTTIAVTSVPKPTATITLTPGVLWPPNHKLVTVAAAITLGADPNATVKLVSVTSSEPDNGLGDGDTANDIQTTAGKVISTVYNTDTRTFQLRAERSGNGPGRVYTITCQVSNASGTITVTSTAIVPHDQGK